MAISRDEAIAIARQCDGTLHEDFYIYGEGRYGFIYSPAIPLTPNNLGNSPYLIVFEDDGHTASGSGAPLYSPSDYTVYAFDGSVLVSREEVRRRHEEQMRLEREAEALEDDDFGEPVPVILDPSDPESPLYTG